MAILEDVQWSATEPDGGVETRAAISEQIHHFLRDDQIIERITAIHGRVSSASHLRTFLPGKFRDAVTALRGLERAVNAYLSYLHELQSGEISHGPNKEPLWNLTTVLDALENGEGPMPLRDLCEEAIRNRRSDLILAVQEMAGQARQSIDNLRL